MIAGAKNDAQINLAQELHKYGVNMRHIGLLRAYVTPPNREAAASSSSASAAASPRGSPASGTGGASKTSKTSAGIMRDRALVRR